MKRVISFLLVIVMLLGNIPTTVFATDEEIPAVVEEIAVEETAAPTEAATEPAVAETEAATEPVIPDETAATAPEQTESLAEEPEASEWITIVPETDLPDSEELYEGYIEQLFYGERATFGIAAGKRLSGDEKVLYDALVPIIKEIARGERSSTVITVGKNVNTSSGLLKADIDATFKGSTISIDRVHDALLYDLPFEMYWYDKTVGCALQYWNMYGTVMTVQIFFYPHVTYRGSSNFSVNTAKTGAAATAASKANAIVAKYAASSDYEKLAGYCNEICDLVSYDHDANNDSFRLDINPWQLISVFDGDPTTNVVCEGYSKAFAYLCDLSNFSGDVSCYLISGYLVSGTAEGHMWNIVTLEGKNYLADITNCDGYINRGLFLAGGTGSASTGYRVEEAYLVDSGQYIYKNYIYNDVTKNIWGTGPDSILTLSDTRYTATVAPGILSGSCGTGVTWRFDSKTGKLTISGTDTITYCPWFDYADKVKSVEIVSGVVGIGVGAFNRCINLTEVYIPETVTSIGSQAFGQCMSLTEIYIPASVSSMSYMAFSDCDSLTDVYFGCTSAQWSELANYIPRAAFIHYSCIDAANHWTSISADVTCETDGYEGKICPCGYERKVITQTAPGHTYVDGFCCVCNKKEPLVAGTCYENLTWEFDASGELTISGTGFMLAMRNNDITTIPWYAYRDQIKTVVVKNGITNIGHYSFYGCSNLSSIKLPDSLTSIDSGSFYGCSSLTSIEIPDGVTSIDTSSFSGCSSLSSIKLPDSLIRISNHVFYNCRNLVDIDLPNSLISLGDHAFDGCSSLTSIDIPDGVTCINSGSFRGCSSLSSIKFPGSLTSIGNQAFYDCSNLADIDLPDSLTSIGDHAFSWCSMTSIDIPDGVTSIGTQAFYFCRNLKSITFEGDAPVIGEDVFFHVNATAYYPVGNLTWTEDVRLNYGGKLNWIAKCTNHTKVTEGTVEATCTEAGMSGTITCSSCGEVLQKSEVISALGHDFEVNITDATCTADGEKWSHCMRCGHVENEVLPALGHDFDVNITDATCTADGEKWSHCMRCGHVENEVLPALGHEEIIDNGIAPTCTETGLTEGKHCDRCGEIYVAQEVIPALDHEFAVQNGEIVCAVCGETVTIHIHQDYVALDIYENPQLQLYVDISPATLTEDLLWSIEGENGILEVDQKGLVTAHRAGTAHVVAELSVDGYTISSRCRIDVTEYVQPLGIQLSTAKATTELYKNEFATFEILLQLPQNYPVDENALQISDSATNAVAGMENKSNLIESARFTSDAVAELFELVLLDDRTVQIVPTGKALENAKAVKSSYADTVTVTVQGKEYVSEKLTLTVKKTLPKLKATVAAFNSFYSGQTQEIVVTGGTVTSVYENETKNTAKTTAIPGWLTLNEDGTLTLTADAPLKNASGKAYVMVETEEWRIPTALTLSAKNTYKAPGLKLSAATVTMTGLTENSDGVALKLVCSNKKDTLSGLNVTNMTAPAGFAIENFNAEDGSFTLKAAEGFKAGKIALQVHFGDTTVTLPLNLTVKTAAAALKLAPTTVTLNQAVSDSGEIKVTSTPADFRLENPAIRLTGTETINGKKTTVDKTASGELDIRYENGCIRIRTTDLTPEKASYKLYTSAGGSKEAAATVNVVTAVPSVTLKATGSMDLSFPTQTATITATFKNYSGRIVSYDCTVAEMKGKTVVDEDVTGKFAIEQDGKTFRIRCTDESLNIANTYAVKLKLILEDGSSLEKSINLKVKRTAVKLKLSAARLSLNKLIGDTGSINITCTTKGYAFEEPVWTLTDSRNKPAEGELTINYKNGQLTVSTNDATVYGKSYKIVLKANEYGTAATLTVSVPTQAKSIPTVTIKAAGKIDVIRDGSAVTVTPTYKNCITTTHAEETVTVSNSKKGDVTSLFTITPNGKGGYTVTKAEGAAIPTGTYKVKLAANFGAVEIASKEVSMSVAMGAAKLTTVTTDTTLFAKDKNDRALVWFEATDVTLNEVSSITFKNAKQAQMFEIIDYGGGLFAIGFKDGKIHESIAKQLEKKSSISITLSLDVFMEGNETVDPAISKTAKANTTQKVKLTIVK